MARPKGKKFNKRTQLPMESADYNRLVKVWLDGGPPIVEQIRQAIKKQLETENPEETNDKASGTYSRSIRGPS